MGRVGSAVLAAGYVCASVLLLYAIAQDRESQGEFDERSSDPYASLVYVQVFASVVVGAAIARRWALVLPLLVLAAGWTLAYEVAAGHAAADVLIRTTFVAVLDLAAVALGGLVRRYRGRSR